MITKYTAEDEEKLKNLIGRTDKDSSVLPITRRTNCIASYAAYENREMVGFIVAWKSKMHPFCTYFRCLTSSNHEALNKRLLEYVESELSESDYPLQATLDASSNLIDYYHNQFILVRKTYLPTVILSEIPYHNSLVEHPKIVSIETIKDNSRIIKKLTSLVKRIYKETHQVNPVAEFNLQFWESMIFAEDLIEEGSFLYLGDNNEILAYSLLHKTERSDTVELGWKGSNSISNLSKIILLVELQLDYAVQKGFHLMEGEFDDTDAYALAVLNHFSLSRDTVLHTFQKHLKGEGI